MSMTYEQFVVDTITQLHHERAVDYIAGLFGITHDEMENILNNECDEREEYDAYYEYLGELIDEVLGR
jgi:hypothetical protein